MRICLDSNLEPAHSKEVQPPYLIPIKAPPIPHLLIFHFHQHHHQNGGSTVLLSHPPLSHYPPPPLPGTNAQSAPAPAPSGPINVTAILEKAGGYSNFIHFLNITQVGNQIDIQVNNSRDGMTVFAPTDNAFKNLPSGTLNNLTFQQQVQLIQYHVCPKYYSQNDLLTVPNPVRTQATGQDGGVFGLNFTGQGNQLNVSTGIVEVPIYNAVRKDFPLAVYQVDKVLLPVEFYQAKAPAASPQSASGGSGGSSTGGDATAPSTNNTSGNGAGKMSVGLGLVSAIWLLCMGLLS